jgi:hypothetical protein
LEYFHAFNVGLHLIEADFIVVWSLLEVLQGILLLRDSSISFVELVECDAKEHSVEKDNLSEPIDTFVERSIIRNLFNFAQARLLDDDAVHWDF